MTSKDAEILAVLISLYHVGPFKDTGICSNNKRKWNRDQAKFYCNYVIGIDPDGWFEIGINPDTDLVFGIRCDRSYTIDHNSLKALNLEFSDENRLLECEHLNLKYWQLGPIISCFSKI